MFRSRFGRQRRGTTVGASGAAIDSAAGLSRACSTEREESVARPVTDIGTCPEDVGQVPRITRQRAGVYTVTDACGRQVGSIRGDHVIGFTAQYPDHLGRFGSLEEAKAAIRDAHQVRPAASPQPAETASRIAA